MLMGMKEEALVWMHREVDMRVRIYGDWNPRTRMAQQMLANALGDAGAGGARVGVNEYSIDLVRQEDIVWEVDPFAVDDRFRVSAVLRMFETLGLISRYSLKPYTLHPTPYTLSSFHGIASSGMRMG